jgi:mannose-6-phosphate isomerase-like protein (cupin superfamily)
VAGAGQVVEEPVSGQRIRFVRTAAETGGEVLEFELWLRGGDGSVGPAHRHLHQEERVRLLGGEVTYRIGSDRGRAGAGGELVVPPGTPHVVRTYGDEEVHALVEVRPAQRMEEFFERFCALGAAGAFDRRRLAGAAGMAALAREHQIWLAGVPLPLQRAIAIPLSALDRRLRADTA